MSGRRGLTTCETTPKTDQGTNRSIIGKTDKGRRIGGAFCQVFALLSDFRTFRIFTDFHTFSAAACRNRTFLRSGLAGAHLLSTVAADATMPLRHSGKLRPLLTNFCTRVVIFRVGHPPPFQRKIVLRLPSYVSKMEEY